MIQRIQTIWLFLASLLSGALFISPLYKYNSNTAEGIETQWLQANNFYPLLIVAVIMTIVPLAAIFMYNDRKKQKRMSLIFVISCISFITIMVMRIAHLRTSIQGISNDQYTIPGSVLPFIAAVFGAIAIFNINKDEKLVRSMDRLR